MKGKRIVSVLLLAACLLTGCGNKNQFGLTIEDVCGYEHVIQSQEVDSDEKTVIALDDDGFYPVSDMVYVTSETLNLRTEPSPESEIAVTVNYGTPLQRTGNGTDGWERVFYENETYYVTSEYVTTLVIGEEQEFDFSQAMLNVVATNRQLYSYDSMVSDLAELKEAYPDRLKIGVIGTTADDRNILEITIGNPDAKKHITIVASVCGIEYMTSLVAMKQIEYYLTYYDQGNYNGILYSDLFENIAVHIIPMLNPDSVAISQEYLASVNNTEISDRLEEWFRRDQTNGGTSLNLENYLMFFYANANGVDIRYNFDYEWDKAGTASEPSSEGYKGTAPASEAETKALLYSLEKWNSNLLIVYHTSGSSVAYRFGEEGDTLSLAENYATQLSEFMNYELDPEEAGASGSMETYANNVLDIPAVSVNLGNGSAPLSLNEFSAIWNAVRESWAGIQFAVFR